MDSLSHIFQQYGITGVPIIDMAIIGNIVPFLMIYINSIVALITKAVSVVWQFVIGYIQISLRDRVFGKNMCTIMINQRNQLYKFLDESIFEAKIPSEFSRGNSKLLSAFNFLKNLNNETRDTYWKRWKRDKHKNVVCLNVDYSNSGAEHILKPIKIAANYHAVAKESKLFDYGDYVFVIEKLQRCNGSTTPNMKIKILSFNHKIGTLDNDEYSALFEEFLTKRFNFKKKIFYVYNVAFTFPSNINSTMAGYVQTTSILPLTDEPITDTADSLYTDHKCLNGVHINFTTDLLGTHITDYTQHMVAGSLTGGDINNSPYWYYFNKYIEAKNHMGGHTSYGWESYDRLILVTYSQNYQWNINFVSFGKILTNDDIIKSLNNMIIRLVNAHTVKAKPAVVTKRTVTIFKLKDGRWCSYQLEKRELDTVYLPSKLKNEINKEFENFIAKEKFYRECQVSYKKGILLYGPPGTGKSSLVKSLAYEYQLPVYMININDDEINDDSIVDYLNSIGSNENKILLFEDIDSAFAEKEVIKNSEKSGGQVTYTMPSVEYATGTHTNKKNSGAPDADKAESHPQPITMSIAQGSRRSDRQKYLTYSGLLNALDGVLSNQNGVITIMTTNYIEKLGAAVLRPGRIDCKFRLGECDREQIRIMMKSFLTRRSTVFDQPYGKDTDARIAEFAENVPEGTVKPCEMQHYILKHLDDLDGMFSNYTDLVKTSEFRRLDSP